MDENIVYHFLVIIFFISIHLFVYLLEFFNEGVIYDFRPFLMGKYLHSICHWQIQSSLDEFEKLYG